FGSSGTYLMNGGTLTVASLERIGYTTGLGYFNQTAGIHTNSGGSLIIGTNSTYSLSGTGLLNVPLGTEQIGVSAGGIFNQSGGTHSVGTLSSTGTLLVRANSQYTLSGSAVLNVFGTELVGYDSGDASVFTQSGGTNTLGSGTASSSLKVGALA